MENREQYKRLIMFFASALILLVQVVIFYYIWHRYYNYRSVIGGIILAPRQLGIDGSVCFYQFLLFKNFWCL